MIRQVIYRQNSTFFLQILPESSKKQSSDFCMVSSGVIVLPQPMCDLKIVSAHSSTQALICRAAPREQEAEITLITEFLICAFTMLGYWTASYWAGIWRSSYRIAVVNRDGKQCLQWPNSFSNEEFKKIPNVSTLSSNPMTGWYNRVTALFRLVFWNGFTC